MLSPSMAFAWLAWRQHRWGLLVVLSFFFLAAGLSALVFVRAPHHVAEILFGFGIWPLVTLLLYPLCVFTYAFDAGDLLARESCFPARLLRLPVPTRTLVVWPMACGAAAAFLLWLGTVLFIIQPWLRLGNWDTMPLWWPSMMAVAILAWTQTLLWAPFGLPGLRIFSVFVLIVGMIGSGIVGVKSGVAEGTLVVLYAGLAVIAWSISYAGVRQARRGHVPNWEGIFWPLRQIAGWRPQRRRPFASAAHAQVWFEWRLTGKTLPVMTGLMLPFALLPLALDKMETMSVQSFLFTLPLPALFAGTAGWLGSRHNRWVKDRSGMMPFIATLPMTTADMVGTILKVSAWSTLTTFALVAAAWPLTALLTGRLREVANWWDPNSPGPTWWRQALRVLSLSQIAAGIVAFTIVLLVWTWKRKLDSLYVGLIGSKGIEAAVAWGSIPGSYLLYVFVASIYVEPRGHYETTLTVWPWLVGLLLLFRLGTTAWALGQGLHQGLLQPRTAARWAAAWLLLASLLFALLAWAIRAELVPVYLLACAVLFVMPMARLAAAPLALAWNRHR